MRRHVLYWWRLFWIWWASTIHRSRGRVWKDSHRRVRVLGWDSKKRPRGWETTHFSWVWVFYGYVAYGDLPALRDAAAAQFLLATPEKHLWGPTRVQVWRRRIGRARCWLRGGHTWEWGSYACQCCGGHAKDGVGMGAPT